MRYIRPFSMWHDGLPSVIMKICLLRFLRRRRMSRARCSPARVLVWYGPTWRYGRSFISTSQASLPNATMSSVSLG